MLGACIEKDERKKKREGARSLTRRRRCMKQPIEFPSLGGIKVKKRQKKRRTFLERFTLFDKRKKRDGGRKEMKTSSLSFVVLTEMKGRGVKRRERRSRRRRKRVSMLYVRCP